MAIRVLIFLDYALPITAAILLAWEWWRSLAGRRWTIPLIIVTISCIWWLLALASGDALAPDYSITRVAILTGNLLADIGSAVISVSFRSQRRVRVILAALCLAWVWFFTWSIMCVA
jgi:hypothetical protein